MLPGADIIARAKEFAEIHGDSYVDKDFEELKDALIADALPRTLPGCSATWASTASPMMSGSTKATCTRAALWMMSSKS